MTVILAATLGCSVITGFSTSATLATALSSSPEAWPGISAQAYFWAYLLGAYLGALTLTPAILALHERSEALGQVTWAAVWRSRMLRDLVFWALPALALFTWQALCATDDAVRQVARLLMLLPVLGLAVRHGWHGAAFGGMAASIALAATGSVLLEPAMIQCQVILALFISGALLVGARAPFRVARASSTSTQDRQDLTVP